MPDEVEAQEPTLEPAEGQEPEDQGAMEPDQTSAVDNGEGSGETDGKAQEPEQSEPSYIADLRQENKRLRRGRSEDRSAMQKLGEERTAAVSERDAALAERDQARADLMRFQVAAERGLTMDWADRLRGSDREELEADAERLIGQLQPEPPTAGTAGFDGGARSSAPAPMSPEQAHNDLLMKALGRKR